MRLIVAIYSCLLCCFSTAQNNPIAGRTFLLTQFDSAAATVNLFNTPEGGVYMRFKDTWVTYQVGNRYTSAYTQTKDSLYFDHSMGTLAAYSGFVGMLEHLMRQKIWKPASVKKLGFLYQNDSLVLINDVGEKWVLVDSASIHQRIEDRPVFRLNPKLKTAFTVENNSRKRFYMSAKGDTEIVENIWGKPHVYETNYSSSSPVNMALDFDTLRLGEAVFSRIIVDKKSTISTNLETRRDGISYLYSRSEIRSKGEPLIVSLCFKYVQNQFEYLPSVNDSDESVFPISAKVEYLKKKRVNGKTYKNIYVLSYELNRNTEIDLVKKCYWASGIGPVEFEFMNGDKFFLINEVKEGK